MMRLANGIAEVTLALALVGPTAWAQAGPDVTANTASVRTFYLNNVGQPNEAADLQIALRNILPAEAKIAFTPSQNAITVRGTRDELMLAQKVLTDLDRPRKTYRLIYTITEMDGGKRVGTQHLAMVVVSGGRTTVKQGSKVPVVTGAYNPGTSTANTQVTYLDVGMNFDASLDEVVDGVRLRTKIEQSSIAEEKSALGTQDPIVRQTVLEGTSILAQGRPLILGSLDITGSTRHLDLEVALEPVR